MRVRTAPTRKLVIGLSAAMLVTGLADAAAKKLKSDESGPDEDENAYGGGGAATEVR